MSSVISAKSQIAPFTYYIVENGGGNMANMTRTDNISLSGNTILVDMGKTIVENGYVFRKVQNVSGVGGYICLNSDLIYGDSGESQAVNKLS